MDEMILRESKDIRINKYALDIKSVTIDISYVGTGGMIKVMVADTGIGIKQEDMDRLFVSFQRLDEEKNRNIEGTGLGLNITKRLVEMMGRTVVVSSEYGKGSVFTVTMVQQVVDPTPIGDFEENLKRVQAEKEQYKPSLIAPKASVLIVDDNDMNLEVIENLLRDTKIQIVTAESGKECIEIMKKARFDVVLLDQMMPGMTGTQALKVIRDEHLADKTPIMYQELEDTLRHYLDPSLIIEASDEALDNKPVQGTAEVPEGGNDTGSKKPLVIVIDDSSEGLKKMKRLLGDDCEGVFVRDKKSAGKYLEKHDE